jgi:hypothetical protein
MGARFEGLDCGVAGADVTVDPETYHSAGFQRDYADVLTSALLLGGAEFPLHHLQASEYCLNDLQLDGLAEIIVSETGNAVRQAASSAYKSAYAAYRKLEQNPITTPVLYLDGPAHPSLSQILDAETAIGEAEFHRQHLADTVAPYTTAITPIFEHLFEANRHTAFQILVGMALDHGLGSGDRSVPDAPEVIDLAADMGLHVDIDYYFGNQSRLPDYAPEDMLMALGHGSALFRSFDDFDIEPGRFLRHVALYNSLNMRKDPLRYLAIHAYWATAFEMADLVGRSVETNAPLYSSSQTSLGNSSAPQSSQGDLLRVYRLFLSERGLLPAPRTIGELQKLRDDHALDSLRTVLREWVEAARDGDEFDVVNHIRRDMELASRDARRAKGIQSAGRILTYVGLPVAVADAINGSLVGLPLAAVGVAMDAASSKVLRGRAWYQLGRG